MFCLFIMINSLNQLMSEKEKKKELVYYQNW